MGSKSDLFLHTQLFRNGQRLLEKQRFQFPPSWLYIDNIEGEWGAFSDIMKRKDTAIQQQVANLQLKIVQEDKAVENRTTDLLNDWEKTKPVAVRKSWSSDGHQMSAVLSFYSMCVKLDILYILLMSVDFFY